MNLDTLPRRLVVISGGFVGMEQGQLFAQLGVRGRSSGVSRREPEMAQRMTDIFTGDGIAVVADRAVAVETASGSHVVNAGRKRERVGGKLAVGVGLGCAGSFGVVESVAVAFGLGPSDPSRGIASDVRPVRALNSPVVGMPAKGISASMCCRCRLFRRCRRTRRRSS